MAQEETKVTRAETSADASVSDPSLHTLASLSGNYSQLIEGSGDANSVEPAHRSSKFEQAAIAENRSSNELSKSSSSQQTSSSGDKLVVEHEICVCQTIIEDEGSSASTDS